MKVTEKGDTFNCSCGFSWQRGQSGAHNCEPGLYRQITALQQKLDAVTAENVALKGFIESRCWVYDDDVERYRDAVNYLPETPATDSIFNGLRAEGAPVIQDRDLKALRRFNETSEDDQGYDIGDEAMDRLVEIGLVAKERGKIRVVTTFGLWVLLGPSNDVLPILTTQRDRDIAFNERIAQLRNGEHVGEEGV